MKEKKIKVLIIEDEKEVSELYKLKLTIDFKKKGFRAGKGRWKSLRNR